MEKFGALAFKPNLVSFVFNKPLSIKLIAPVTPLGNKFFQIIYVLIGVLLMISLGIFITEIGHQSCFRVLLKLVASIPDSKNCITIRFWIHKKVISIRYWVVMRCHELVSYLYARAHKNYGLKQILSRI